MYSLDDLLKAKIAKRLAKMLIYKEKIYLPFIS